MVEQMLTLIETGRHRKGGVIAVPRIACIQAAKRCAALFPSRHPIMLSGIDISLDKPGSHIPITTTCRLKGAIALEMKALAGADRAIPGLFHRRRCAPAPGRQSPASCLP
jgi:cyclic pyranopterin phosphate synthase